MQEVRAPLTGSTAALDLDALRRSASRFFTALLWLHVPVIAGIALANHLPCGGVLMLMAGAALAATIAVWLGGGCLVTRLIVATALTLAPTLMVYAGGGSSQIDWHSYFFVIFGMLTAYVDWRPIALSVLLTVAHHVILGLVVPSTVFPQADLAKIGLHGTLVLGDAAVLLWIVREMRRLFARLSGVSAELEVRIAERTAEINALNDHLAAKVVQVEDALRTLERDAAERAETARRLDHLASHDAVTELPNRTLLVDRLTQSIAAAQRSGTELIVISLDLNDFKNINDVLGHAAGDDALAGAAARIGRAIRSRDTASRVGSDEFVIVCAADDGLRETPYIIDRLTAGLAEPLMIGSTVIRLAASTGISLFPADGSDPEELIRKAEAAMFRAKGGAAGFALYTPEIHAEMLANTQLRHELETAASENQFVVYYQPIVSLATGAIVGAEALVRWQHPERGLLAPGEFIGFAEKYGLIAQIGAAVFTQACAQIERFAQLTSPEFTLAVNVSALQFRESRFIDSVRAVLAEHAVGAGRLEVEITESIIMDDIASVIPTLHRLNSLGIRLSIDDFGTGYSSLAYLKSFPVHTLKIDRSFIIDIATNKTDQAIAATIIALAHNLGMRVIAEGVETADQLERIRALGADDIQGYFVSRPVCAADFIAFVRAFDRQRIAA